MSNDETSARDQLLAEINEFLRTHQMNETRFGALAVNDPALLLKMRRGRGLTFKTIDRVRAFIRTYKPDGKQRPKTRDRAVEHAA